jgi:hypothetical protein
METKYKCTLLILIFSCFFANAQIVNIPDANFKNALVNGPVVDTDYDNIGDSDVDTNDDGEIQVSEAEAVNNLYLQSYGIISLEGIQSFINLGFLNCSYNEINDIDLTQNINLGQLHCYHNQIVDLDLTQNINLIHVNCAFNNIEVLDVSQNLSLSTLHCRFNNLSTLDVSNNLGLRDLGCTANNLSALDVSSNTNILFLTCGANHIEELDLSQNVSLYWFQCQSDEELTFLDLRNGGNSGLSLMWAYDTPNLRCILVDDKSFADSKECGYPTSGWCKDENDIFIEDMVDCVLSSEDFTSTEIILYPNPTNDILRLQTQLQIENVKVYSVQGNLMKNIIGKTKINVSDLSQGIYFLEVNTKEGRSMFRFAKN